MGKSEGSGKLEATGEWVKVRTRKTVDCGKHYQVDMDKVVTPGGKMGVYWVVRTKPFAMVIPQDEEGNLHMVRQHRYPLDRFTTEFPAGSTDGQVPVVTAKRELEEEMGLEAESFVPLGRITKANGLSDLTGYLYLARNVRRVLNPLLDPADQGMIERLSFTTDEIRQMIAKGEIEDAGTISAFARAELMGLLR